MTSRKWVHLFLSTLVLGGVSTVLFGFLFRWKQFQGFGATELLWNAAALLLTGLLFSVLSQMGFFAYLTVHRFGLGMFRSASLWNMVQVLLVLFVLFDFVYLRSIIGKAETESVGMNIVIAAFLLVAGLAVAYVKSKETNQQAFIPALFFMVVVTIAEWMPALRTDSIEWLYLMIVPLLLCNAYQILILHRLVQKKS
ncbi:KinB-signaling pathway activation protein [Ectobacillus ponti]|uniref:KinB-signaling pathway activation protein n=1 Tax=Ectobacillus ponti TaxID=2961894 RepID=A0AA41XCY4_9BACI|nr:KinB-signaling pathway activation protein [Ectobacillus ponti]MCP8971150.1 KinB-signaling pathway activation protein [Ectobacillus ponti]